jgi:hypothetical protein
MSALRCNEADVMLSGLDPDEARDRSLALTMSGGPTTTTGQGSLSDLRTNLVVVVIEGSVADCNRTCSETGELVDRSKIVREEGA